MATTQVYYFLFSGGHVKILTLFLALSMGQRPFFAHDSSPPNFLRNGSHEYSLSLVVQKYATRLFEWSLC